MTITLKHSNPAPGERQRPESSIYPEQIKKELQDTLWNR